jgi:Arc/MetJ-type ribon-helix-helix transcriptional regulator
VSKKHPWAVRGVTLDLTPEDHALLRRVVQRSPYPSAAAWMRAAIHEAEIAWRVREEMARREAAPVSGNSER